MHFMDDIKEVRAILTLILIISYVITIFWGISPQGLEMMTMAAIGFYFAKMNGNGNGSTPHP